MQDTRTLKTLMVGALMIAIAALLTAPAQAQVVPYLSHGIGVDQSQFTGDDSTGPQQVIPYLSHGVGVDQSQYTGVESTSTQQVVPYLSHGVGVDQSQFTGQTAGELEFKAPPQGTGTSASSGDDSVGRTWALGGVAALIIAAAALAVTGGQRRRMALP